jgi:hypothetical protein
MKGYSKEFIPAIMEINFRVSKNKINAPDSATASRIENVINNISVLHIE